jgi:peroxiredoxin
MFVDSLLILILASFWGGIYLLLKQQGRILIRLDAIEAVATYPQGHAIAQPGLPLGEVFPPFQLTSLEGKEVALEDYRGQHVLLVNWNPACGYCELLAPELAGIPIDNDALQIVLLAHGSAEANRSLVADQKLNWPVLLMPDATQIPKPFETPGTPAAYLLDVEGRVASPLTVGADAITELIQRFRPASGRALPGSQPLAQSRIMRDGLKAGTPAPSFKLPDLEGRMVSLEDFRHKPLLLVFSDPHCGPCDELAPQLASLHRAHANNGLGFVMVGRGDAAENRRKAEEHRISFPVVLQDKWKLSKEYGIFTTPVAFLIGEDGLIRKDVAVGVDAIKILAQDALQQRKD